MATFFNQATLSYNGNTTTSNITTGELIEVLSATKTAVSDTYEADDRITYVISIVNTGNIPYTNLTISDDLGRYTLNTEELTPLTYVTDSIKYFTNGTLQAAPAITAGPPLLINGITVPANGNATIVYEAITNNFAPLDTTAAINNTATITGPTLGTPITAVETITASNQADLTISKSISPSTVTENSQVTYTFIIQNTGNIPATINDNVIVTDAFAPILSDLAVSFEGNTWTEGIDYTYGATGTFASLPGRITVPAATYTQNPVTGEWAVNPGVSTLTITGTI